jgi:uncharacterized protein CbrC (UPF0167 family)
MKFRYFEHPEKFTGYLDKKTTCDTCGATKQCFDGSLFYGEETISAICPECLKNDKLKDRSIFTCEGDREELTRQLAKLHPELSNSEIKEIAQTKTIELEKTTPHLISWQDWAWPCADGDYCTFIGYGSKTLYNRLAKDKDGQWLFQLSLYYTVKNEEDADELWEEYMPDKAIKNYEASAEFDVLFYVFKSLTTDTIITLWDAS